MCLLRNHELIAQKYYPKKKQETSGQETLDAIHFAHDRLGLKEGEEGFNLKFALKNAKAKIPLPKQNETILDISSDNDNFQSETFFNAWASTSKLSSNTNINKMQKMDKNQLTLLAMKANLEFQKILMDTIQKI